MIPYGTPIETLSEAVDALLLGETLLTNTGVALSRHPKLGREAFLRGLKATDDTFDTVLDLLDSAAGSSLGVVSLGVLEERDEEEYISLSLTLYQSPYCELSVHKTIEPELLPEEWVVLSKPIDVTFTKLPKAELVKNQLTAIERQIADLQRRFSEQLAPLLEKKASLSAITHDKGLE